jgi:antitoxin (DNA-binding transcriptional repressor) of toxin-antitoxin stability system
MKLIPLIEAKANLSRYGRMCLEEPVIVTVNGVPSCQLAPLQRYDELVDRLLAENPKFVQVLEDRSRERTVPLNQAR